MKKLFFISMAIAILASFFASTHPDGLDFVAEKFGFAEKGIENVAPMPGYSINVLPEGGISTSMAGIAGILIILALFWLAVFVIKKVDISKTRKIIAGLLILFVIGFCSPAFAARPLFTDDYGTVDQGAYELEIGYNSSILKSGGATTNGFGLQLKKGITSNFDLGIEAPFSYVPDACLGDMVLHAKYKFIESSENNGLTGRFDIKLCNADSSSGNGSGYYDYTAMIIYSKEINDIRTHYNLGYTLIGVPAGTPDENTINYSLAAEKEVKPGTDIVAEYFSVSSAAGATGNILIGGRLQASELLRFDLGYSMALNDNSENLYTIGLTASL